jgi:exodeoxyribonuclease-3
MKGYSGVAVHVRKEWAPDRPVIVNPEFDHQTRIAVADLGALSVASVYVPNGGRDYAAKIGFLQALESYVVAARTLGRTLVVCGDLNITRTPSDVHPKERDERLICQRPEERALLERILDGGGLHDVGRELDPTNEALYTWWAPWRDLRQRNIGWRLDYVLASDGLAAHALSCSSYREIGTSDHAPVVATFGGPQAPGGTTPS